MGAEAQAGVDIDVEICRTCGGAAKVIACIEDPVVIKTILAHLEEKAPMDSGVPIPDSRAPPHRPAYRNASVYSYVAAKR